MKRMQEYHEFNEIIMKKCEQYHKYHKFNEMINKKKKLRGIFNH